MEENSQHVIDDVVSDDGVRYTCVKVSTSIFGSTRLPRFVANHQEGDSLVDEERRPEQWCVVAGVW